MIDRYEVDSMIDNVRNDARYYAEEEARRVKYDLENQLTDLRLDLLRELRDALTILYERIEMLEGTDK